MEASPPLPLPELQYLHLFLTTANWPAEYDGVSEQKNFENLLIRMGENPEAPDWARLYFMTDVLAAMGQPVPEAFHVLDLTLPLGLQVPNPQKSQVCWLLSVVNAMLPGPVLLFNEQDGIYFRTSFVLRHKDDLWPVLLLEALQMLQFFLLRIRPTIAAVVAGEKKLKEALADIETQLATPPAGAQPLFEATV